MLAAAIEIVSIGGKVLVSFAAQADLAQVSADTGTLTVEQAKRYIQAKFGLGKFAQRLVHDREVLGDDIDLLGLPSPVRVVLVLLPYDREQGLALAQAARAGVLSTAQQALRRVADPDIEDAQDWTPLCHAASFGHADLLHLLHDAGADVNKAMRSGATPLFCASEGGHLQCVRSLCKLGAEINKAAQDGATPMFIAALRQHTQVVRFLCDSGAEKDKARKDGATPICIASLCGLVEVVALLCESGADCDKATASGATPLCTASQSGHADVVRTLCGAGADKERSTKDGMTPLRMAVQSGHVEVLRELCDAGADPDRATPDGVTPMLIAAQSGHAEMVRLLCRAGAGRRPVAVAATRNGETPMLLALQNRHVEVARLLLFYLGPSIATAQSMEPLKEVFFRRKKQIEIDSSVSCGCFFGLRPLRPTVAQRPGRSQWVV